MGRKHKKRFRLLNGCSGKFLLTMCIVLGSLLGFCVWWCFTRCEDPGCMYHYFPLPEMFLGAFNGLLFALIYWEDKF